MGFAASPRRTRIAAAFIAAAVQLGLIAMLVLGLAVRWTGADARRLPSLVTITPSVRPPTRPTDRAAAAEGAAAPAERESEALPLDAPSPPVALASPRQSATEAGEGDRPDSGTAAAPGIGRGAGGDGAGEGAGQSGAGSGSGTISPPLRVAGALRDRDYPRDTQASGTVAIAFRVRSDGRVDDCSVIGASGAPTLDRLTCDLVERRFRYRPARDASGRAVATVLRTTFTWGTRQRR